MQFTVILFSLLTATAFAAPKAALVPKTSDVVLGTSVFNAQADCPPGQWTCSEFWIWQCDSTGIWRHVGFCPNDCAWGSNGIPFCK